MFTCRSPGAWVLTRRPYDPSVELADGMASALSRVDRKRLRSGGASDATQAGKHLPRWVEPEEPV